ncbi:MAG: hypothetical protein VZR95_05095 [Alphaproteobacteria bacterium]|jgi:hypothetical protein
MNIKDTLKHAWNRLKHLNVLRTKSRYNIDISDRKEVTDTNIKQDNSRDYQNTKPGEHVYTRRPNSRGSRTL